MIYNEIINKNNYAKMSAKNIFNTNSLVTGSEACISFLIIVYVQDASMPTNRCLAW